MLRPLFEVNKNDSSILIHKSHTEICINDNAYVGDGEIRIELLPYAKIFIYGYFSDISFDQISFFGGESQGTSFSFNDREIAGYESDFEFDADTRKYKTKWCPYSDTIECVGSDLTEMSFIVFHIFNFFDFIGTRHSTEQEGSVMNRIEHVDLLFDDWAVEIKSLTSTRKNIEILKKDGGYGMTHISKIRKNDNSLFDGKDAKNILQALRFFLSFARGKWCEPICAVGFDEQGEDVWKLSSFPKEPWDTSNCWFDPHHGSQLEEFFVGFMKKWKNDNFREVFAEIIYWYLNANNSRRGIDVGIILTQAAIEKLSYEYAVTDKRLKTANGFKSLKASDKFRLLFSSLGIPQNISSDTSKINELSKNLRYVDTLQALTEIRNSLIHSKKKNHDQLKAVYYEAWNLGLWYLEMGLLAICNYSGTYSNRLKERWVGDVENVPWINS